MSRYLYLILQDSLPNNLCNDSTVVLDGDFNDMVTNVTKLSSELTILVIVFFNFDKVSLLAEVVLQIRAVQNPANTIKGVKRGFQRSWVMFF